MFTFLQLTLGAILALIYLAVLFMILAEWFGLLMETHIKHGLLGTCLFFIPPIFLLVYWSDTELRNSALRLLVFLGGLLGLGLLGGFLLEDLAGSS